EDPWADVWVVDKGDVGSHLECGPGDIFKLEVEDAASSGFLWESDPSGGFEVVDTRVDIMESYGAESSRTLFLRNQDAGAHRLILEHRRPWSDERLDRIEFVIANFGREV